MKDIYANRLLSFFLFSVSVQKFCKKLLPQTGRSHEGFYCFATQNFRQPQSVFLQDFLQNFRIKNLLILNEDFDK